MSELTFLPWARAGAAAALNAAAVSSAVDRPSVDVGLRIKATTAAPMSDTADVHVTMRMLGPGDVTGFDANQVIRVEPADGATGVETEIFPAVDLDHPGLPWLFSPEVEQSNHRLRPWLCLVVVREQPGVTLNTAVRRLIIAPPANPAAELPDLAEAFAWAHVQYAGVFDAGDSARAVAGAVAANPAANCSRLLSPRRLEAYTRYVACVVPTYASGVQAGLGGTPGPDQPLDDAWRFGASETVTLPVYFSFRFSTGESGDFLSLAQAVAHPPDMLDARAEPVNGLGPRTLDLTQTGFAWPREGAQTAPASIPLPTILRTADAEEEPQALESLSDPVREGLLLLKEGLLVQLVPTGGTPQLRPPVYGATHAGVSRRELRSLSTPPRWLNELNLDPRLRVAAGLGVQVVATEQEALVASAWQQVEQAQEVNADLSRAQLARVASYRHMAQHLSGRDALTLLQLTSPQAKRIHIEVGASRSQGTVVGTPWALARADGADLRLPAVLSAAYRRMSRPRGPIARRTPSAPAIPTFFTTEQILDALDPGAAVESRVLAERLSPAAAARAAARPDAMRELALSVTYQESLVNSLAQLAPDALLAGLEGILPNTAVTLSTNRAVIAAFMVGANSEVVRELVWRGVPIDRRATPFRWFWDIRGQDAGTPDIATEIADWRHDADLKSQVGGTQQLVLAMRADLLRRYPRTAVYALKAVRSGVDHELTDETQSSNVRAPRFTASIPPDLRLFGFDLDPADAIGSPGWFFVLQEQASETRFGCEGNTDASYWTLTALRGAGLPVPPAANSAVVAEAVRLPPLRCAIHARALLPASSAGGSA